MPRSALATILAWFALAAIGGANAATLDPHLDQAEVPGGCSACHEGHGLSGSPMLPAPQVELCLGCHGSRSDADRKVRDESLGANAQPQVLGSTLSLPYTHPLTESAFSREEPGVVTCTSCHTPHRGMDQRIVNPTEAGRRKLSTRNPNRFEVELCRECHGSPGTSSELGNLDSSSLSTPSNASYHPLEGPASTVSPSTRTDVSGAEINCTDCHGNSDPSGARGPHGSLTRHLLRMSYVTTDGNRETADTYALCYSCHERQKIMSPSSPFPFHESHVVQQSISCATCHNPHGSQQNRALIRFGEQAVLPGVAASPRTGRLAYVSTAPQSGACYVMCHGSDHDPYTYGGELIPFQEPAAGFGPTVDGLTVPLPTDPLPAPQRPVKLPENPPPGR